MSAADSTRFDALLSRHLDEALTDGETAELLDLLADGSLAARFLEMYRLNSEIAGLLAAPVPDAAMVELVRADIGISKAATQLPDRAPLTGTERTVSAGQSRRVPSRIQKPPVWSLAWAALFLVLGAGVVWFVNRDQPAAPPAGPFLASLQGEVRLMGPGGERVLTTGELWPRGETLKTVGPHSAATVTFEDGTRIELGADSVAVNESGTDARRVELERGEVQGKIPPQPAGRTFVFATPVAEAVIVGTMLQVTTVDPHRTRVVVTEGQALVRRRADGAEITVNSGFHVLVSPQRKLTADPNDSRRQHH